MENSTGVTSSEVLDLLDARIRQVLALAEHVTEGTRFDEDLHADSLDLVEVIEGVEQDLAARGVTVSVPDDELVALRTVGQAADVIAASSTTQR